MNKINHIAIIMDGNGRWAKNHGVDRIEGHNAGVKAVRKTIKACKKFNIQYLTLYAFSTENWKRSKREVTGLMSLLSSFLDSTLDELMESDISLRAIGQLDSLPYIVKKKLNSVIKKTKNNKSGVCCLALSYGGRSEIVDTTKKIAQLAKDNKLKISDIDEDLFSQNLYAPDIPNPELIIRTSGEFRISNFLLWQLSYSEFYISDILWPDFDEEELKKAIDNYNARNRRFGGREEE